MAEASFGEAIGWHGGRGNGNLITRITCVAPVGAEGESKILMWAQMSEFKTIKVL